MIQHNFGGKKAKSCVIINFAVPGDYRIFEKNIEKIEKHQNSKRERERERERERAEKTVVAEKG